MLVLIAVALPLRYGPTLAEPDLVRMMAALVYGNATHLGEAAGKHYGIEFSFAWYRLLHALVPVEWLASPLAAARAINRFGVASGLLCAIACVMHVRQVCGTAVAVTTATLFLLAPASLPLMFSGHPIVAATACLFLAGWSLNRVDFTFGLADLCVLVLAEAELLARTAPRHLLILADSQQYLIAYLIAADPQLRWVTRRWKGIAVNELSSVDRRIVLVEKYSVWPRDVTVEALAHEAWRRFPVHVQRSTLSRFDVTTVPIERRFQPLGGSP